MDALDSNSTINWMAMKSKDISSTRPNSKASPVSSNSSESFAKVFSDSKKNSQAPGKTSDDSNEPTRETESAFDRRPLPPGVRDRDLSKRAPERVESQIPARPQTTDSRAVQVRQDLEVRSQQKSQDESVDTLEKRQALQGLLKKMKTELGIDAEQIVAAFASLTPQELQQPPELTLDKVIQALPLDPQQQTVARAIFQDMLKQTAVNGMADYLKGSHRQLSLEVLSQREAQKRQIGRGLEQMQSQFFGPQAPVMAPPQQVPQEAVKAYTQQKSEDSRIAAAPQWPMAQQMDAPLQPPMLAPQSSTGIDVSDLGFEAIEDGEMEDMALPELTQVQNAKGEAVAKQKQLPPVTNAPLATATPLQAPQGQEAASQADLGFFLEKKAALREGLQSTPQATLQAAVSTPTPVPPAPAPVLPPMNMAVSGLNGSGEYTQDDMGEDSQQSSSMTSQGAELLQKAPGQSNLKAQESFVINTQPTQSQEAKNIREIVSQAQFLAQKGGGEMKVSLTPEGLGQVNMKVAVKAGQISVEMVADSSDAKRVLERGLGELKSSLLAHNLKVDQIRVDLPSDISRHLGQQPSDDAQRQFAQQFLEQFRQDNREWRGAFTDITGAKAYRTQREDAQQDPIPSSNNRRRENSRRLDLVA